MKMYVKHYNRDTCDSVVHTRLHQTDSDHLPSSVLELSRLIKTRAHAILSRSASTRSSIKYRDAGSSYTRRYVFINFQNTRAYFASTTMEEITADEKSLLYETSVCLSCENNTAAVLSLPPSRISPAGIFNDQPFFDHSLSLSLSLCVCVSCR